MSTNINDTSSSGLNLWNMLDNLKSGWDTYNSAKDYFHENNWTQEDLEKLLQNTSDLPDFMIKMASEAGGYAYGLGKNNLQSAGLWDSLLNMFTGNLDYQRQLQMLGIQNAYNSLEAEKARNWSKEMSSTEYQRTIKDLASSGLNPYAVLNSGSVNSTPSAAVAHNSANYQPSKQSGWLSMVSALGSAMSIFSDALLQERKFDRLAERDTNLSKLTKKMKEDLIGERFRKNVQLTNIRNDLKSYYDSIRDEHKHSYRLDELKAKSGYNLNRDAKKWRYIKEFKDEW